jgi:hypothetical protein
MIESYMEKLAFIRAHLSYIRVIMVIMRVSLVELLCQMAMGHVVRRAWAPVATFYHVRP